MTNGKKDIYVGGCTMLGMIHVDFWVQHHPHTHYGLNDCLSPQMNPPVSQTQLTFHCDVVHGQLQALSSSHHLHCVPLVVIQLLPRKQCLRSFACSRGEFKSQTAQRERCVRLPTHPSQPPYTHTQSSLTVGDRASGENLHVCETHSHYGFSQYAGNERNQISGLTDCKIERLLKTSQCCSRMPSKKVGQKSRNQLRK